MKATIDGIACDGTPEEINEFKKLRDAINEEKLWRDLTNNSAIPKSQFTHAVNKVKQLTGKDPIVFGELK